MKPQVLLDCLLRAGVMPGGAEVTETRRPISKADMFSKGLSGKSGSKELRAKLIKQLDLPEHISADALLDILNAIMSREDFLQLLIE